MMMSRWYLFVVYLSDDPAKIQSRYFRKMKGYKKVERRGEVPREYIDGGMLREYNVKWLGNGCFMIELEEEKIKEIYNEIGEVGVNCEVFLCEKVG